jgi:hypothetical protein
MERQKHDRFVEANERPPMTNKLLNPTEPGGRKPVTGKHQALQFRRRENMRAFMVAAIAATFAAFPLTPGFAKSEHPGQTASKPGASGVFSADAARARARGRTTEGDSSDPAPYVTDPLKTQPTLRQWVDALFRSDGRR